MKTNSQLKKAVMAKLKGSSRLRGFPLKVSVSATDGIVTLTGEVDSYSTKLAVERTVENVTGVKLVSLDVDVQSHRNPLVKSDKMIAAEIFRVLERETIVNENQIDVKVKKGWVFLNGNVDWDFERRMTKDVIEHLSGIKGITNNIKVNSNHIDEQDISDRINAAIQRKKKNVTPPAFTVHKKGNTLDISGSVRTRSEREEAEQIAWSSPGVFNVRNMLAVDLKG
jgi:osmotically-inducible protein OsmY